MFIKIYLIALPVFLTIDMIWLGVIARNFYQKHIGFLMTKDINWLAAIIFYLLFIAGLVIFVIIPSIKENSLIQLIFYGSLFGLITYATYDLTNLATIKNWPLLVTIVDLIWGSVLSLLTSVITYLIAKKIGI